jgi:hypothetical protein
MGAGLSATSGSMRYVLMARKSTWSAPPAHSFTLYLLCSRAQKGPFDVELHLLVGLLEAEAAH